MRLRRGGTDDTDELLRLFDEAVVWLTERGSADQWGTRPWSEIPERVERVRGLASDGLWIAEINGATAGALVISETALDYAPPVDEREVYVRLLLTDRRFAGRDVGGQLLDHARSQARERGISLVRVDCWSGGDGSLIRYYERQGFTPTVRAPVGDKEVQVFEDRLGPHGPTAGLNGP
ncbi:GNAT family N-acetyltransferase [Nocardiopsis eucommiae]|uniref:GNAT family N-acetyltransferase n=1 Tax=Nocardiopsis eucommiae TaxID=2831970 RepID=A0A975LB50_9ACTN|nr:GNAT family N-acetyltransferase [Nocardiopsis eucommiae]